MVLVGQVGNFYQYFEEGIGGQKKMGQGFVFFVYYIMYS